MKREKTCRICLCHAEELKSLRDKLGDEQKSILEIVNFVVNINMKLKNDLPDKICNECVTTLELADIFKRCCLESEEILGQYHSDLEKKEFFEEVPVTFEKQSLENVVGKLLKKEDDFAVYANVTISKSKKSKTNLQTIEPGITEIKDDGTLTVKIETETFGNDFDYDTEYLDNNEAGDLDTGPKIPTKSEIRNTVKSGNVTKNKNKIATTLRKAKAKYPCIHCGAAYLLKNSLSKHIKRKHDKKYIGEFECPFCKKKYNQKYKLNAHMSTVHVDITAATRIISCKICGHEFKSMTGLNWHLRMVHGYEYYCKVCRSMFATKDMLEKHNKEHTDQKQLCTICGKRMSVHYLTHHVLRHKNIRAFQCDHCQKSFITKGDLKTHMRSHTGDQPFLCNICGRGFTTSSGMLSHRRKHSDARPFVCEYCPKSFKEAAHLKHHTRTHTGEKPYKCTVCEAAFNRSHHLTGHMRRHARDTPNIEAVMAAAIRERGRPPGLSEIKLKDSDSESITTTTKHEVQNP